MKEMWKPIKGYEGLYEVSNTGKCRSLDHYITRVINGEFIKTFHSATSASREIGIDSSWIIACCRGTKGALTAGGFKWKYADE